MTVYSGARCLLDREDPTQGPAIASAVGPVPTWCWALSRTECSGPTPAAGRAARRGLSTPRVGTDGAYLDPDQRRRGPRGRRSLHRDRAGRRPPPVRSVGRLSASGQARRRPPAACPAPSAVAGGGLPRSGRRRPGRSGPGAVQLVRRPGVPGDHRGATGPGVALGQQVSDDAGVVGQRRRRRSRPAGWCPSCCGTAARSTAGRRRVVQPSSGSLTVCSACWYSTTRCPWWACQAESPCTYWASTDRRACFSCRNTTSSALLPSSSAT